MNFIYLLTVTCQRIESCYSLILIKRVRRKELAAGTLKNYYRAAKLFCEMNGVILNWKRIVRGLPRTKNSATKDK